MACLPWPALIACHLFKLLMRLVCHPAVYYEMMPIRQANADNKQQVRSVTLRLNDLTRLMTLISIRQTRAEACMLLVRSLV